MTAMQTDGMHHAILGISPLPRGEQWFAWCETCATGSSLYDDRTVARDLVALHLVDPSATPLTPHLEPDAVRARAAEVLGEPTVWL